MKILFAKKCERLGIEVVVHNPTQKTTTSLVLPKELFSVEEALKKLSAALRNLERDGFDQSEVLRLRTIISMVKSDKKIFADYLDYHGLEDRLVELEAKYK
jgi:hypothetical protein